MAKTEAHLYDFLHLHSFEARLFDLLCVFLYER